VKCNADDREGHCNANDGFPCPACAAALDEQQAFWLAEWEARPRFAEGDLPAPGEPNETRSSADALDAHLRGRP
jgi:hypothetical protein